MSADSIRSQPAESNQVGEDAEDEMHEAEERKEPDVVAEVEPGVSESEPDEEVQKPKKPRGRSFLNKAKRPLTALLRGRSASRERKPAAPQAEADDATVEDLDKVGLDGPEDIELPEPSTIAKRPHSGRKGSRKKQGGWQESEPADTTDPTKRLSFARLTSAAPVRPPSRAGGGRRGKDDDDDVPYIQELSGQDFGSDVAHAPHLSLHGRVANYRQLDNALMKTPAFATMDHDLDLALLMKRLCPETDVREDAVPWSFDYLFTCVATSFAAPEVEEDDGTSTRGASAARDMSSVAD